MHVPTLASIRSPDGSDLVTEQLGLLRTSVAGDVVGRRERQARDVIHGDHMSVAGPARGDALLLR